LVLRQLAGENKLKATPESIDQELKKQEQAYAGNAQALQNIQSPGYRQYIENLLINRQVIELLKKELS
jgi:FKBP-type peptidyl-prolyl cis-trans isomerase (trigger factor)